MQRPQAFSLVELSIVLVILGLLVGGILAGQSLIRASELRAVGAEHQRWSTATSAFRDKYFAIPGDMGNATSFWGDDASRCASAATADGTPGTCNGDKNGWVFPAAAEQFLYWQHLVLAGLIEGGYNGKGGTANGTTYDIDIRTNVPGSKLSGAGWNVSSYWAPASDSGLFVIGGGTIPSDPSTAGNFFAYGADDTDSPIAAYLRAPVLTPTEAWNIDTKLDDGTPNTGKLFARINGTLCSNNGGLTPGQSALDGITYTLSGSDRACSLLFIRQF